MKITATSLVADARGGMHRPRLSQVIAERQRDRAFGRFTQALIANYPPQVVEQLYLDSLTPRERREYRQMRGA